MAVSRGVSIVVIALVHASATIAADNSPKRIEIRELLDALRAHNAIVTVEMAGTDAVTGRVGQTQRTRFYVLDGTSRKGRAVAYADVRTLIDTATGERLEVQQAPGPIGGVGHLSWKAWVIVLVVLVTAFVIFVHTLPST